eukprot:8929079-Ditylum_brightwellii.AAC.1
MVTFSKPSTTSKPQGNGLQKLKIIITIERSQVRECTKGNYHMYRLCTVPYNTNLPMYNIAVPFYNNRSV